MEDARTRSLAARLADALSGEYTIEGEIGRGGMGVVYVARDLKLKRRVAIKVLPPDLAYRDEIRTRFVREAQTAARLSHPHIVPIHSVGEADGLVYFVMGYVDGESLGARLKRRGRLPVEECRRIMSETADALTSAHTLNIIHRDIKPDNILLDGTRRRVMVTDFGIAKALSEGGSGTLTGTGVAIGTPTYMSPEQAAGEREIDPRSDLYALGVVAYEMITGRVPFKAPTVPGILMKQITEPPPEISRVRPECPDELAATILRCLEKDPSSRWPTADALRRALESRTSAPYRARPSRGGRAVNAGAKSGTGPRPRDREWREWVGEGARYPAPRRERRPRSATPDARPPATQGEEGEPSIVRKFRAQFASYVSVNGCLLLLNILTGLDSPWFLFPAVGWGIGLASQYGKLWSAGYSWRDVIHRPPARDAVEGANPRHVKRLAEPSTGEFGEFTTQIRQIRTDRQAIMQMIQRLPESERALLPDIGQTVDALANRAVELGRTLSQMEGEVDAAALEQIDKRVEALEGKPLDRDGKRRLELLQRQRQTLADLVGRRDRVEAQFESCLLAVQNMRFDLLRLRSAGVAEVLDDLTMVTQQAKALSVDVNAAIEAAGEIKEALKKT